MDNKTAITVKNLSKTFTFPVKNENDGWLKNLLFPEKRKVDAVKNISFEVEKGERLAFIGPNGAGKSTTIKMLSGILFPTAGEIKVLGYDPSEDRKKLAYKIGTVFGQRSQLFPNLPVKNSLEFFGVMYDLSDAAIKARISELEELFTLHEFIEQPVRKLSLGQRMRAEIAASLIHNPEIIFLDEPTIGLDIVAKKALRELLRKINREKNTTIFLTSHDVGDIEMLCERTIIVDHGTIVKDLPTKELAKTFVQEKYISVIPIETLSTFPALPHGIKYINQDPNKVTVAVDIKATSVQNALKMLLDIFEVQDIDVYDPDLETVIRDIYESGKTSI